MSVDSVFQALGDPTRRALLERLGDGHSPSVNWLRRWRSPWRRWYNTYTFWSRVT